MLRPDRLAACCSRCAPQGPRRREAAQALNSEKSIRGPRSPPRTVRQGCVPENRGSRATRSSWDNYRCKTCGQVDAGPFITFAAVITAIRLTAAQTSA